MLVRTRKASRSATNNLDPTSAGIIIVLAFTDNRGSYFEFFALVSTLSLAI